MKEGLQNLKCPNCGYERAEDDDRFHSKEECPKCGIFYKKYVKPVKSSDEKSESTKIVTQENDRREVKKISLDNETKKCLFCAETIKLEAIKCRFCNSEFDPAAVAEEIEFRRKQLEAKASPIEVLKNKLLKKINSAATNKVGAQKKVGLNLQQAEEVVTTELNESLLKLTDAESKKMHRTTALFLIAQFLIALPIKAFVLSQHGSSLYWTGIILGWGCLYLGVTRRKKIAASISKLAGRSYLILGIILLFISGGLPGGWILAICHQVYGLNYKREKKSVLILAVLWTILCLLIYTVLGILLSLFGVNPFEK